MGRFSTELELSQDVSGEDFARCCVEWIKGIKAQKIFSEDAVPRDQLHDFDVGSDDGTQRFRLLTLPTTDDAVVGARYDVDDDLGRRWRVEATLRSRTAGSWCSVRAQCLALVDGAVVERPKKPFFVKMLIRNGWALPDADLSIQESENHLEDDGSGLEKARSIFFGEAPQRLPIIYVSRTNDNELAVDPVLLARDVAGLAHVVVEPTRAFSFKLKEACRGRNVYGGAVGLVSPGAELIELRFIGQRFRDARRLREEMAERAFQWFAYRSHEHAVDFATLLELHAKSLRQEIARNSKDFEEFYESGVKEIEAKDEIIARLEEELRTERKVSSDRQARLSEPLIEALLRENDQELYPGETMDAVLRALKRLKPSSTAPGIGARPHDLIITLVETADFTKARRDLVARIKASGNAGHGAGAVLQEALQPLGFTFSHGGAHPRFEGPSRLKHDTTYAFVGTASDHRSPKNQASQVLDKLDLKD